MASLSHMNPGSGPSSVRLRITAPLYREPRQNIVSYRDRKPQKITKSWMKPLLQ